MKYPKEYFIKWRENNREKTRKSAEKYRSKHPERILKYRIDNKAEVNKRSIEYYRKNKDQQIKKRMEKRIMEKYNLTIDQYNILYDSQNGKCAICEKADNKNLSVDHNHQTGKVRSLLCARCNLALGNIREDLEVAKSLVKYIERYK